MKSNNFQQKQKANTSPSSTQQSGPLTTDQVNKIEGRPQKKLHNLLVLGALIILLTLLGVIIYSVGPKELENTTREAENEVIKECEKHSLTQGSKDFCYTSFAQTKPDLTPCERVENEGFRSTCFKHIAIAKKDFSLCHTNESNSENVGTCQSQIALDGNDVKLCEQIEHQGWQDLCYSTYAEKHKDISLCGFIKSEEKNRCIRLVAVATSDIALCNTIIDASEKDSCNSGIGKTTNNISLCDTISDITERGDCYMKVAFNLQDSTVCEKIPETIGGNNRIRCFTGVAALTKNQKICEMIKDEGSKAFCLSGAK